MPVKKRSRLLKSRRQVYKMEFVHKSVLFAETVAAMQAAPLRPFKNPCFGERAPFLASF